MPNLRHYLMLTLPSLPIAALAAPTAPPQAILAMMCQAEGGTHWQNATAMADIGTLRSEGLTGKERDLVDLQDGRQRSTFHFPVYNRANGIDTRGAWQQDRSGQVHPLDSPEADTLAVTDRWLARRGYCDPARQPAALKILAPTSDHGIRYERIEATPPHGRAVTLWIDRTHHQLARSVMLRSFQTVTVR